MSARSTATSDLIRVIDSLGDVLFATRTVRGLSQRDAAKQIGVAFATVSRIERGEDCVMSNARAVLVWLQS